MFLLASVTWAATLAAAPASASPSVGLVLGGGGARGAAHIGVLEVLEQLRVPVDCIAGTSMGALVAGAYAAGLSPAQMRNALAETDWSDLFNDDPNFSDVNPHTKSIRKRYFSGLELGITEQGVTTLPGVVSGQKIKLFFNRLVGSDSGEKYIEDLPLPLAVIATDIGTGERVVYRDGSLSKAMRASMSVPGLLDPVSYRGRKLVDGGLVDNVPIGEVKELCRPDVVIAVNVGSPLLPPSEVGSLLSVSAQMVSILTEQNVTRSLKTLRDMDIYIKPDLEGISAADFDRSTETADRGHAAAQTLSRRLSALSVSEPVYAAWQAGIEAAQRPATRIDAIKVAELKDVNPATVQRHLRVRPGEPLDTTQLQTDVMRIYGDGYYETVDYQVLREHDRTILRLTPVEKAWGPNYLRFGFNLDSTQGEGNFYSLRAAHHRTWINALGGESLISAQIGTTSGIYAELYQPLNAQQTVFLQPVLRYLDDSTPVYEDNRRIAEYESETLGLGLYAGMNFAQLGWARAGWLQRYLDNSVQTGSPTLPSDERWVGGLHIDLSLDQTDTLYFPSEGWKASIEYFDSSSEGYSKLEADAGAAWPLTDDIVLTGRIAGAMSPRGQLPAYDAASLGGFRNLSGFARDQIIGDQIAFGSLSAEYILGRMPLGLSGDIRLGLSLEGGKVDGRYTETRLDGWLGSAAVYLGGETPVGPVYLGYGYADRGQSNIVLFIGTP